VRSPPAAPSTSERQSLGPRRQGLARSPSSRAWGGGRPARRVRAGRGITWSRSARRRPSDSPRLRSGAGGPGDPAPTATAAPAAPLPRPGVQGVAAGLGTATSSTLGPRAPSAGAWTSRRAPAGARARAPSGEAGPRWGGARRGGAGRSGEGRGPPGRGGDGHPKRLRSSDACPPFCFRLFPVLPHPPRLVSFPFSRPRLLQRIKD
jgi:hypothetical protein